MAWNLCSSQAAIDKAGTNANSTVIASGPILALWSDQTEGFINSETRKDWITNAATTHFSGALADVASSLIANKIITYDMSGYTSRQEALTMLNVHRDTARLGIAFIKDEENKEKMI